MEEDRDVLQMNFKASDTRQYRDQPLKRLEEWINQTPEEYKI